MELNLAEIIGLLAACMTTASFLPQAIQTIKTKNTDGISLAMYIIFSSGVACWTIFGFLINSYTVATANFFTLILALIILFIKIKNNFNGSDKK